MMFKPHRHQALWYAHFLHRVSGLALALFLPLHFLTLGTAIEGAASFDRALDWTASPLVKVAEFGLVFLLAVHFFGGLRLLAVEFLPWSPKQKTYAAVAVAGSFFVAVSFFLSAV